MTNVFPNPVPNPTAYLGVRATNPPNLIQTTSNPGAANRKYPIGTLWVNTSLNTVWMLSGFSSGVPTWTELDNSGGTGAFTSVTATTTIAAGTTITAGTGITATTGNITATNGNFVATAVGTGLVLNSAQASGVAASPVVVNGRSGRATFTTVSIAAAADLTLTLTNSSITASTTEVMLSMSGATTGSALSIKSKTASAGSLAIVITNGTGATTTTADIQIDFLVLNA